MTALALSLLLAAPALAADQVTAEQALENYRKTFPTIDAVDCPPATGDEVLICGRRTRPSERLPLPVERAPGARIPGEPPSAASIASRTDRCSPVGRDQVCTGTVPVIPVIVTAIKGIQKIIEGDD